MIAAMAFVIGQQANLRDEPLLDELQKRAFRFFWDESNPDTGFTKDRAANFQPTDTFDVSSCASTGFALAAYPIGVERKWVTREEARKRTLRTLENLLKVHQGDRGWYYHFVHWKTGQRVWNSELSSIDTSILLAGVIVAESYWRDRAITEPCRAILERVDWAHMLRESKGQPDSPFFSMGWKPETGWIPSLWDAYYENLMLFLQAYGLSEIRTDGWDRLRRSVYQDRGFQSIEGGPLFMHQMSHVFYDFANLRDRGGYNYWVATRNATLANRAYCIDNPLKFRGYGADFWGISACDTPDGYRALGAPPRTEDNGTITPTSAIASLAYTPKESLEFANEFYRNYPKAWGRYGFSNGVNVHRDYYGPDVIGIDLGMMLLGIENHRTGLIHKISGQHSAIKRGFARSGLRLVPGSNAGPLQQAR
jgi:hypothetical protein